VGLGLAHKILDTFEKMDTINPTFELIDEKGRFSLRLRGVQYLALGRLGAGPWSWRALQGSSPRGLFNWQTYEDKIEPFSNFNHLFGLSSATHLFNKRIPILTRIASEEGLDCKECLIKEVDRASGWKYRVEQRVAVAQDKWKFIEDLMLLTLKSASQQSVRYIY
jgi:hypothetical protein